MLPKLKELFLELDVDNSGGITLDEISQAPQETIERLREFVSLEDFEEIFNMLDYDSGGTVEVDEFCDGILRAQADKPMELLRLMRQCTEILNNTRALLKV